jgi:hypothetical protein
MDTEDSRPEDVAAESASGMDFLGLFAQIFAELHSWDFLKAFAQTLTEPRSADRDAALARSMRPSLARVQDIGAHLEDRCPEATPADNEVYRRVLEAVSEDLQDAAAGGTGVLAEFARYWRAQASAPQRPASPGTPPPIAAPPILAPQTTAPAPESRTQPTPGAFQAPSLAAWRVASQLPGAAVALVYLQQCLRRRAARARALAGWRAWFAALGARVRRAGGWGSGLPSWAPWTSRAPPRRPLTVPCIVQRK